MTIYSSKYQFKKSPLLSMKNQNLFRNKINIKISSKSNAACLFFVAFLALFCFGINNEARAGWFDKKEETCQKLVDDFIAQGVAGIANMKLANYTKDKCYEIILSSGNYKELYAYYRFYKYADEINTKYNKRNNVNKDLAPNDAYYWMLFYANQNSREFDPKTQIFKKEQGLYEQELKDFEDQMNQEEKIKSFSYVADNLATGKEGWVKIHDYKKSFEYLKKAAEAGDVKSQLYMGYSYFTGNDWMNKFKIKKDFIGCYKWLYTSTKHSQQKSFVYNDTKKAINTMLSNMTQTQIQQAKKEANIWLEQNKDFIKNHPLKIIPMTDKEIKQEREKTDKFIKDYKLNHPLPINNQ